MQKPQVKIKSFRRSIGEIKHLTIGKHFNKCPGRTFVGRKTCRTGNTGILINICPETTLLNIAVEFIANGFNFRRALIKTESATDTKIFKNKIMRFLSGLLFLKRAAGQLAGAAFAAGAPVLPALPLAPVSRLLPVLRRPV